MEQNENTNQQEQQQENQQQEQQEEEKRYTQAEVDQMINKRLARERKNNPQLSNEELAAFREYQKTHPPKDDAAKLKDVTRERDSVQVELEMSRRENFLLRQGIEAENVDFYVYKISKSMKDDEEFEDAAKAYLKEHKPRSSTGGVRFDTGGRLNGGKKPSENDAMNALIRGALR